MNRTTKLILVFVCFFSAAGIFYFSKEFPRLGSSRLSASAVQAQALPLHLDERSKTHACETNGAFPDHACTPGAVFSAATVEQICTEGYAQGVRNVPVVLKKKIYAEYGLSYPQRSGAYEADHFIPLELGGSNDIANLFPEAADPIPGFHEKDLVENYLHHQVCSGLLALPDAERAVSNHWVDVYNSLSPDELQALRQEFSH